MDGYLNCPNNNNQGVDFNRYVNVAKFVFERSLIIFIDQKRKNVITYGQ